MPELDPSTFSELAIASTRMRLAALTVADLDRPSSCEGWMVRDVLAHLVGGNVRFAQALRGQRPDWQSRDRHQTTAPLAEFDPTAAELADAIEGIDDPTRHVLLPAGEPPASFAVRVHAADMLIHGWDIAVSTNQDRTLPPELCVAAMTVLERYPSSFWGAHRYFATPPREVRSASPQERLLTMAGRDPTLQL